VRPKITVLGDDDAAARLRAADVADVETDLAEIAGSAVVVLFDGGDDVYAGVRERAPNAVVLVAQGAVQAACETTLFPRTRIVGLLEGDQLGDVVESILFDRRKVFTAVARCEGERGLDGEFAPVPVKLGAGGIVEIVESED
jgi:hypothetical protein